ncbi:alanyl-tRNA editing protein Aarsd1-like [Oscarella lobularis]|uniref:alanyl-tRNA editing protein Aarsd1-like n=1 Tax=Oscarella lobularis TaxID=121494 RepID=UPI0033131B2D
MSFFCQRDSYARKLDAQVVACTRAKSEDGKRDGFEVELSDTVLFPEGGGQPDDRGTISGVAVERVVRRGGSAIHFVTTPLDVGSTVQLEIDWTRRFDHMQQHTGQHLITAIADAKFGSKTVSWCLGPRKSFLELDCDKLSQKQINELEVDANQAIRNQVSVNLKIFEAGSSELEDVRSRGLPDDHVGPVRIIEIEGIDSNMCCGTHVSNLGHLQAIKLLYAESKRGHTLLYYLSGQRVLDYLHKAVDTERKMTKLLSCGPENHVGAAEKVLSTQKSSAKTIRLQLREIAELLAYKYLHAEEKETIVCVHRDDGDIEFMNVLAGELVPHGILCLISVGPEKGAGQFLLAGPDALVASLGPKVAECLQGKGGGRKGRFQGKATKLSERKKAEDLIRAEVSKN